MVAARCGEGEATDRARSSHAGAGVCHTQSGENLCSFAAAAAASSPSSSSSLSERMRQRFVPGHFFRFADNKPSRFASSLPSFPPSLFPLLSMERRSPPPPTPRCEWRDGNTGDVKIGPLFIASSLLINCIVSGIIFNRHDVDRWKPTSCSAKREAICMKNHRISPLPFPPECV